MFNVNRVVVNQFRSDLLYNLALEGLRSDLVEGGVMVILLDVHWGYKQHPIGEAQLHCESVEFLVVD